MGTSVGGINPVALLCLSYDASVRLVPLLEGSHSFRLGLAWVKRKNYFDILSSGFSMVARQQLQKA